MVGEFVRQNYTKCAEKWRKVTIKGKDQMEGLSD